jgi:hypothetical protein
MRRFRLYIRVVSQRVALYWRFNVHHSRPVLEHPVHSGGIASICKYWWQVLHRLRLRLGAHDRAGVLSFP